jgi:CRP/FNR family cyclic AMP-dependent transcriptional regulator
MDETSLHSLAGVDIFSHLSPTILKSFEGSCSWDYRNKDDQIIGQFDTSHDVYFIIKGSVGVVHFTIDGREVGLELLGEGKCFGEMAAIDREPRSSSIIAKEPTLLAKMSAPNFIDAMACHPSVGLKVMIAMAGIIRTTNQRVIDLSTLSAYERVLLDLIKRAREQEPVGNALMFKPFPSHSIIAAKTSTTRETVARIFSALAKKEIIRRSGSSLEILDVGALERTYSNLSTKRG